MLLLGWVYWLYTKGIERSQEVETHAGISQGQTYIHTHFGSSGW